MAEKDNKEKILTYVAIEKYDLAIEDGLKARGYVHSETVEQIRHRDGTFFTCSRYSRPESSDLLLVIQDQTFQLFRQIEIGSYVDNPAEHGLEAKSEEQVKS